MKLNIGSFTVMLPPPWVNLDILDLSDYAKEKGFNFQQVDITKGLPFDDNSVDFINCSHLIEHITVDEGIAFLKACRRVLKPDGRIRLGTPDVNKLIDAYKNKKMEKFNEIQPEEYKASPSQADKFWRLLTSGHKTCYDAQSLQQSMELAGFKDINQTEYNSELDMYPEVSVYVEAKKEKFAESRIEVTDEHLKIMVISTTVFPIPLKGYGGLEALVYEWSCEFAKQGHQVSVVAPEGSVLPEGMELIPTRPREDEGQAYLRYKDRLGEFDVLFDNSWLWYTVLAQMESERQLPVVHIYHSDPDFLPNPPPIKYPCIVGLSKDHARRISEKWQFGVRTVYNGIPLDFYQFNPSVQRNGRYLWCARYTPEKMPLETIRLAKKCNIPLDLYGNTSIIRDTNYLKQCMAECDAKDVVFHLEVPREETVKLYQTQKALIHLVNYNEAFGLVPVEAMATGMPVIVNRRGALPELVEDGVSGFVVNTIEEAEEIIKSGKVDTIKPEDCRKLAEQFSIEASAKGYLGLFREVVSERVW